MTSLFSQFFPLYLNHTVLQHELYKWQYQYSQRVENHRDISARQHPLMAASVEVGALKSGSPPVTYHLAGPPQRPQCQWKEAAAGGIAVSSAAAGRQEGHAQTTGCTAAGQPGRGSYLEGVRQRCSAVRCLRGGKVAPSWRTGGL